MSKDAIMWLVFSIAMVIIVGGTILANIYGKKNRIDVKFMTRTAIFSAVAIILYTVPYLKFHLPIFPAFLEIHLEEVPGLIAGFAYGPLSGFFVCLIKTIVKLPMTSTKTVGEFGDFLYNLVLIVPAAYFYQKHRTLKGAGIAIAIGTVSQLVVSSIFTTFVLLNFYMSFMGFTEGMILGMCQAINPNVTSLTWPFMFMVCLPFNALKDAMVIVVTMLLYKNLEKLINKIGYQKETE